MGRLGVMGWGGMGLGIFWDRFFCGFFWVGILLKRFN